MTLLDKFCSLDRGQIKWQVEVGWTYCTDCLSHLAHAHKNGKAAPAESSDGELVVYIAQFCLGVEDADVIEFGEKLGLQASAEWVLGGKKRETMCK